MAALNLAPHGTNDFRATVRPAQACQQCGTAVASSTLQEHPQLGRACRTCRDTAAEILRKYDGAAARHRSDFVGQLQALVRDSRAGVDDPTWYRGIDG